MKIGYIISQIADGTGVASYTYNLLQAMADVSDHEFVLLKDQHYSADWLAQFRCIDLPYSKKLFPKIILGSFFLKTIQRKERFDLIHDPAQIAPFLFKTGTIQVVTIHDLTALRFKEYHTTGIYLVHKYLLPWTLRNIDKIIAVSGFTGNDIAHCLKIPAAKTEVIYEAAENIYGKLADNNKLQTIKENYRLPNKFLLSVGTLEPRKGIDVLIKGFARISSQIPDYKLVIAGKSGWKCRNILNRIKAAQLSGKIIYLGYVPKEHLPFLYNLADIFVYPSYSEGFGLPLLEAMACGCPVITCDNSSLTEIADKQAALLIESGNEGRLADAILRLIQDIGLKRTLIEAGFKRVNNFSWKQAAIETVALYERLV